MPKEKQVVSLEIAQRMDKLGIKGESLFCMDSYGDIYDRKRDSLDDSEKYYPAYTVAEMGEMLPKFFVSGKEENGGPYFCKDDCVTNKMTNEIIFADSEAKARGLLLCYLKENNLL